MALVPAFLYMSILLTPNFPGVQSIMISAIATKSSVTPLISIPLDWKKGILFFVEA